MNNYMVLVNEEYVDGCASLTHPDGEFGGEGYVEYKNTLPLGLGRYQAKDEKEAVKIAAQSYELDEAILYAVKLAPTDKLEQLKALAIKTQVEFWREQEELITFGPEEQLEKWDEWTTLYERVNHLSGEVHGYVQAYCLLVNGEIVDKRVQEIREEWFYDKKESE